MRLIVEMAKDSMPCVAELMQGIKGGAQKDVFKQDFVKWLCSQRRKPRRFDFAPFSPLQAAPMLCLE